MLMEVKKKMFEYIERGQEEDIKDDRDCWEEFCKLKALIN